MDIKKRQKLLHRVCMVSDFFYPRLGGVEMHIWCLSQYLMKRGHKVIVVTIASGKRKGIRYMTNGLKVYYIPVAAFHDGVSWPTLYAYFPLFRNILIREGITIVHGHQATSNTALECMLFAKTMGYKVVYTDHSLFGFADAASIHLNKLMKYMMCEVDHAIAVSNTCRENLVLRACMHPDSISVIPNAIDPTKFTPDPSKRFPTDTINIVIISRLTYRKGIDLVVQVIPILCQKYPELYFIIGGDGNKKLLLEEMRENYQLHERVELLGAVPHEQVRDTLNRGHIFLNSSLTEAFCIAIVEAASCGLFVVSTKVGGVPEVLPSRLIKFAEPTVVGLVDAVADAIPLAKKIIPSDLHNLVKDMYSWVDVSTRTELVYDRVHHYPITYLAERFCRYESVGGLFGQLVCCFVSSFVYLVWKFVEWMLPQGDIEIAPDFPCLKYTKKSDRYKFYDKLKIDVNLNRSTSPSISSPVNSD